METARTIVARQQPGTGNSAADEFLKLLQDPFVSSLQQNGLISALASSFGFAAALALGFSLLRPYNTVVYAPKLKHADEKHAPPPLGKGIFAWVQPLWSTTEADLVNLVGMDATVFLRFIRMCRNMFVIMAVLGCSILIPTNMKNNAFPESDWLVRITPLNVWGSPHWATVAIAWLFTTTVCSFLWYNYRKVVQLRRQYFMSEDYQQSLHARTLMLYDIPKNLTSDEGIARIIDGVVPNSSFSRTAVARDVKILPSLIEEHSKTVRKLEKVLAKYLKDPKNLPAARPECLPSKKDPSYLTYTKGQKVDAIEYLTQRIKSLEIEIKDVRQQVDKRGSMPYGFASYAEIAEAHSIAYACRKKKAHGATVTLAPRPNDIIWSNMPLSSGVRRTKRIWNNIWVVVLTVLWIAPNAMIAIFLVNLSNLGRVWPAFQDSLARSPVFWSIVQGIASPAITSLIYLVLPTIFRRMSMKAGDQTKTGRERHVVAKLYAFFVFNNLVIFSLFSALWSFIAGVVQQTESGTDAWQAILKQDFGLTVFSVLCYISPFWVFWLLQRQLGAAIDLAQLWPLVYSFFMRKLSSPTPREMIELTAPPPFDYASYYNYFLFYATVAFCYAPIQPLVLPAAAVYFSIDVALKKYLLLYIFVTKTESGGVFWRVLFNRLVFATIMGNVLTFLVVWVRGDGSHMQAYAVAPLPFLMIAFKIFCARVFDDRLHYFSTRNFQGHQNEAALNIKDTSLRNDRLAARFGHPALYKPLITPMVHAKAQNILASIYQGRLSDGRIAGTGDSMSVSGYSDTYVLDNMASGKAGKLSTALPGFEVVPESRLDFEFYKNRDEFAAEHGAGELFGRQSDMIRPGTPGTMGTGSGQNSRPGTPTGGMGFASHKGVFSPGSESGSTRGTTYQGYAAPHHQQSMGYQGISPYASPPIEPVDGPSRHRTPIYNLGNDSHSNLVQNAAGMPLTTDYPDTTDITASRDGSQGTGPSLGLGGLGLGNPRAPGMLGGGPYGYGGLPQTDDDVVQSPPLTQDPAQYDYFRGNRRRETRDASGGSTPGTATRHQGNTWQGN
ncbi:protein OSCA1 [Rhypophila decipiens]